ncbi:hypothetical protein PCIT_a2945 [Pseudoalteromonas citrea]|uniref:Uncharacterized protein n=2 Tax=Pseudoalteromonas citrea TaxID=43655 RepID=A0AAD4AHU6_9GAMM|nr:hypothetical protein [Pseudoalteromonas citrea]KAF7770007.1 hypothetical protein PCIT_a2945 [Pseudoalteromonas citrea]
MNCVYSESKGMCIDGHFWLIHPRTGEKWSSESVAEFIAHYTPESIDELALIRADIISQIKRTVASRLTSEYWRVQRAQERLEIAKLTLDDSLVTSATEHLQFELTARENLRQASNLAELDVADITDINELNLFNFIPEEYMG